MGADIKIESRSAVIHGVPNLTGTQVRATDLRAGALVLVDYWQKVRQKFKIVIILKEDMKILK